MFLLSFIKLVDRTFLELQSSKKTDGKFGCVLDLGGVLPSSSSGTRNSKPPSCDSKARAPPPGPTMAAILTSPNAQTVLFRLNKDCAFSRDTGLVVGSMLGHGGSRPGLMMFPQNPHFLLLPFSGVFTFWTIWDLFGVGRRRVHSHFP